MKKKKLALLLAVAMTVTSIDSTAMMVNAADFTSEEVQEQSVELTDEPSEAAVETDAETEDGGVISDNSSEDESIEITDEPQESADTEGEDAEIDIQEEDEASPEDVFSAEDEIAVLNDEGETQSKNVKSVKLDTSNCKKFIYGIDYAWMNGLSLDVTYEDDSKETVAFADGGIWANDTYGNSFHYDIVDSDNASCISKELEKGKTYMLVVYQSGTIVAKKEISVVSIEESDNFRDVSLNVGLNSDIDSPEEEEVYYKFTAPEDDFYYVADRPYCGSYEIYRETATGYEAAPGDGSNLKAGESLYFKFYGGVWIDDGDDEGYRSEKVEVCIEKGSKSIDSVELKKNSCIFTKGLDNYGYDIDKSTVIDNALTINYADGTSIYMNPCLEQTRYGYGNKIETYVLDADGNRIDWEKYENGLTAGKYTIQINVGDKVLTCTLEIKDFDLESLSVLKEGKQTLNLNTSKQWFKFTTGSKAEYRVNFSTANSRYAYPSYTLKYYDENNVLTNYYSSSGAITGLRANTTYIVGLSDTQDYTVTAELFNIPAMKSLKVKSHSPEKMTFIHNLDYPALDSAEIEVVFDDNTKETLSYQRWGNEGDKYGRYLTQTLYNEQGDEVSESADLEPGNYTYVFSYGVNFDYKEDTTATVKMKVVDIAEADLDAELTADKTTTVTNDGSAMLLQFTPSADGRYKYQFNARYIRAQVLDSDTKTIINKDFSEDDDEISQDYDIYATMEADKTYYLYMEVNESVSDIQVTVSRLQDYKKMSATLTDKDRTYVELLNTIGDIPMEVALTTASADGKETTRKLRIGETVDGYTLQYKLVNKDDSDAEPVYCDSSHTSLKAGTWEITPCLCTDEYDEETDEAVTKEIVIEKVNSVEITVASVESLPEDEYIRLTAGECQDVAKESRQIFVFRATEKGTYFPEIEGDATYVTYTNSGDEYDTVDLEAGEYMLVQVTAYEPAKIRMTKKVAGQEKTYDLYDGFDEELPIARYDSYEFTFKPTEDGTYKLDINVGYGDSEDNPSYNSAVYCDGKRDTTLDIDEPCQLKAGHTYTYTISEITGYDYFEVYFNKVKDQAAYKEIKNIELVPEDDKEFNVISGWDAFQVKVTAADNDNTVEYFSYDDYEEGIAEKYGNDVELHTARKDVDAFGAGTYEAYFSYGKTDSDEKKKTAKQTFTMPPISSYKTIALQGSVNPLADAGAKDSCIYRFEATEDADYVLESSASSANIRVYRYYTEEDEDYGDWEPCDESANEYAKFRGYKGRTYLVEVSYLSEVTDKTMSLKLKKDKTIKSVEIKDYPADLSVYRGNEWKTMKINELVVHVAYTDGSGEDITGLGTDSCGNMLSPESGEWIDDETYRFYLKLDKYRIYIDFKAASATDKGIPQAEVNVPVKAGEGGTVEFTPTESGFYSVHRPDPRYSVNITCKENGQGMSDRPYLEKGKTYTISGGYAIARGTEITVVKGLCDWEITTKKATCTQEGESVYVCKAHDNYTTKVTLGKLSHEFGAWKLTKEASCVDGEKQRTCSLCNYVEKRTIKATKSHSFSAWKVTKNATVLAEGVQQRSCSVCGKTETASVAKLPATIALNVKGTIPLKVKQSFTVKVTMGAGDRVVSWKTSNKKVVSVKNGKIKGLKAGKSATITVQLASGKKASFKVKVQKPAVATKSIKVTNAATGKNQGKKATLKRGQSLKLKAALTPVTSLQKVTWSTSNKKIVTVSKSGVIKAKKKGKATITVKSGNKKYNIKITVK